MHMITKRNYRKHLLDFIDKRAFDTILALPTETYTGKDRETFMKVQKKARDEKRKFHHCKTAEEVKKTFLVKVHFNSLEEIDNGLEHFQLSILPRLENEFIELCKELEV